MNRSTERLILKNITMDDLDKVHELHSLPETDRFITLGIPASLNSTRSLIAAWIDSQNAAPVIKYTFSVVHKNSNELIGIFGVNIGKTNYREAEIWYKFYPAYWNKGYATEAVKEILFFCFKDLALHRVEAGCAVENTASIKVLEKAGFTREGRKRKKLPIRGEWVDNFFYAVLAEDLNMSPGA